MQINNVEIFSTEDELILSFGNEHVIKINGKDKELLETLIENLIKSGDIDEVYHCLKTDFGNDRNFYNSMISFLIDNGVLTEKDEEIRKKNILVIGRIDSDTFIEKINFFFERDTLKYTIIKIIDPSVDVDFSQELAINPDIVLLLSPFVGFYHKLQLLSDICLKNKIPVLHAGIENSILVVGPLIDANLNTPSLNCYLTRRAAGVKNLNEYLSSVTISNKKTVHKTNLVKNKYLNVLLGFIGNELEMFFSNQRLSNVVGNEIEFDCITYTSKKTKILKTSNFKH